MAGKSAKRARSIAPPLSNAPKRQKTADEELASDSRRVPVAADALPWNDVEMPEMFDDAEGFFGLEEVEGVQVVREGNMVKFTTASSQQSVVTAEVQEEFEGFGNDDEASEQVSTQAPAVRSQKALARAEKKAKLKEQKRKSKQVKAMIEEHKDAEQDSKGIDDDLVSAPPAAMDYQPNVFAALEAEAEDDEVDVSAWDGLQLSSETLSALGKLGFSTPTAIQNAAIPEAMAGHDVIGKAATGSGKTLAFGIPVIESWLEARSQAQIARESGIRKAPTALILAPTRELAHQLKDHLTALCASLTHAPFVATVTGGLSIQKQQRQLATADIIIGTPGRLWEVISSSNDLLAALRVVKFLVIDEADRLLTEGHFKEATEILEALDRQTDADEDVIYTPTRQTLVFSATFHKGLQQKLAGKGKHGLSDDSDSMEYLLRKLNFREDKPIYVDVNPASQMAEGLREGLVECAGTEKDLYLYALLLFHPNQRILIFCNSIYSVKRLTPLLANLNLPAQSLHSQMIQKARMRSIERFSSPKHPASILVATDVAARGLDISGINLVIHYHLPRSADMYVHRSGRTARAAATGASVLICAPEEVAAMRRLVAKVHARAAASDAAGAGAAVTAPRKKYYMRSLDVDRRVVARLKGRVTLAKKIADSGLAKEKKGHSDEWVRGAAAELGVDYDSDEFAALGGGAKGRGTGRRRTEMEARATSSGDVAGMRAALREMLAQRVNVGTSERYLTSGSVDVNELLRGAQGNFLGRVDGIGLDV